MRGRNKRSRTNASQATQACLPDAHAHLPTRHVQEAVSAREEEKAISAINIIMIIMLTIIMLTLIGITRSPIDITLCMFNSINFLPRSAARASQLSELQTRMVSPSY
jgi:hypothetical protein